MGCLPCRAGEFFGADTQASLAGSLLPGLKPCGFSTLGEGYRSVSLSGSADFPVCGFTGLSSPVFLEPGDWKVARTRRLESLMPLGFAIGFGELNSRCGTVAAQAREGLLEIANGSRLRWSWLAPFGVATLGDLV